MSEELGQYGHTADYGPNGDLGIGPETHLDHIVADVA